MKYKLIAMDIDGTLLNSLVILPSEVKKALNFAKRAGMYITLATGRLYRSAYYLAREVGVNTPLVANDGAQIQDVYSAETVYYKPMPIAVAQKAIRILKGRPLEFQVFLKDKKIYAGKNFRLAQIKKYFRRRKFTVRGFYNYYRDFISGPLILAGNLDGVLDILNEDPVKLVIYGPSEPMAEFRSDLIAELGNNIKITSAIPNYIDVLAPGVSKAHGLKILGEHLGVRAEEIIAIGDGFNDMEMINYAGLGVVMGNAPQELKDMADYVTLTNDQNGIAQVVKMFIGDYTLPPFSGIAGGLPLR
jgi:Cof subfamily protein (haloacid dehalogenase superfamily)